MGPFQTVELRVLSSFRRGCRLPLQTRSSSWRVRALVCMMFHVHVCACAHMCARLAPYLASTITPPPLSQEESMARPICLDEVAADGRQRQVSMKESSTLGHRNRRASETTAKRIALSSTERVFLSYKADNKGETSFFKKK